MIKKLYDSIHPTAYKLKLNIDSENLKFTGTVSIVAKLLQETGSISLHAKELDVLACSINGAEVSFSLDPKADLLLLESESVITGNVELAVEFKGNITDAMHGMYPCYFEHEGKRKKLIATQFESHHAREVFPCIDEPAAKATFEVELVTPENETVLSNMPVKNQKIDNSRQITVFETTPVMSTYLLAFVCGEMVSHEASTKDGVVVRSWASAAQDPATLEYSAKEAANLIDFYDEYFGVPYPLPKCDQIALPDFEVGAMENWGLVTYRETTLISDPFNISLSNQQLVSLVIAHELSHQWFGNLVTMQWWDDLWLNESFANMTEYLAVDKLHPEWHIWEEFVAHDVLSATNRDVYSNVQPVRVSVNHPDDIHTLFDPSIVYAKGGKLLKVLLDLLGEDVWRAGLKDYFTRHAYGNTVRDNLWEAFNDHTKIDVPKLMDQWIEYPGQPLVTVTQTKSSVTLQQERLLLDSKSDDAVWQVPLLDANLPLTLDEKSIKISLDSKSWVRLNQSGIGHYIANYTETDHKKWLATQLAESGVETAWKIARLNELTMLAKHGDTDFSEALEVIQFSQNEDKAMVWSLVAGIIGNARMLTEGNEDSDTSLKLLAKRLAQTHYDRLGWDYLDNETSNTTHLRTIMLGLMVASEDQAIVDHALQLYRATKDVEKLPAEIRSLLMGVAAKFGTQKEFSQLLELNETTQNAEFKDDIMAALAATKDPDNIITLLNLMLDPKVVRQQDLIRWYIRLLRNRYAKAQTWQWLEDNWDWILEKFTGSKSFDDFARYSASFLSTNEMLEKYTSFFGKMKHDPALKRAIAVGTEEIKARVAWRKRDEKAVSQWLKNHSS